MENRIECRIRYNHVGYGVDWAKRFFVAVIKGPNEISAVDLTGKCFLILNDQGRNVLKGELEAGSYCSNTDEFVYNGDFSALKIPGRYKIKVFYALPGKETVDVESSFFEVSDDWVHRQFQANIKSFYYQRTGVELPVEFAGKWARPAAHLDDSLAFHAMMNRGGCWNAHGGWYDAGDYGKYIVNGGVSVGALMWAQELCENLDRNFTPSFAQPVCLRDEIRFELEFFLRMQDADGGVFFKVTPGHWDGFVMPQDSDVMQKRFIMGKSTTSTLNFAGALAQAHRVFREVHPKFAERCLAASIRAYSWAMQNPKADWPHNTEGSGGYGDDHFDDEFFWARTMLYRELRESNPTGQFTSELRSELLEDVKHNPASHGVSWRDTQNMGWFALALQPSAEAPLQNTASQSEQDSALQALAIDELKRVSDEMVSLHRTDAYGLTIRKFVWGSNGEIANDALTLLVTYRVTQNLRYLEVARELLHFVYGRNPVDTSFVTGSAWSSPMHPHHRICHSDGIEDPIPGLLVGGINNDRQDMHRMPHYPGDLPGFAYTDERCSFASNETAINWNAPLTTVLALLTSFS